MSEPRDGELSPRAAANGAATRLAAARARLILDRPFLGALVLRLPLVEAGPWCRTAATDMKSLYYNRAYIEYLSVSQVEFLLAHEALHCALAHFTRRGHRVQRKWDLACDFAINPILAHDGLKPPPQAIVLARFENMTAEEIYPCLDDSLDDETLDQHLYDDAADGAQGGAGPESLPDQPGRGSRGPGATPPPQPRNAQGHPQQADAQGTAAADPQAAGAAAAPEPLSAREREALTQQWRQHLAAAAQHAQQAGKLGAAIARLVDTWLAPTLPWRALLAHCVVDRARTDYHYSRPSRREGEMIRPSLRGAHCDLVVAIDTSGSIAEAELAEFVAEVNAIKGTLQARITLLACDARLADDGPWVFESWDEVCLPGALQGGGGTAFAPVFEWVDRAGLRPDALVYFTDGQAEFPAHPPPYPVLWLVKGKTPVPWGQRIQLN